MKFVAVAAAFATTVAAWSTEPCGPDALPALVPYLGSAAAAECEFASEYPLLPPQYAPSENDVNNICGVEICKAAIQELADLKPQDCLVNFFGLVELNVRQLVTDLPKQCLPELGWNITVPSA